MGARWRVQWVTADGRTTAAPAHAAAWIDFGYDDTATGSYGCTSFTRAATVTASALVVGREKAAGSTTAASRCPFGNRAFEEKFRKIFAGPLTSARRVDDLTMDLKSPRGDYVAVKLMWPKGLFGRRWQLDHLSVEDTVQPLAAGWKVYFVFHRDGTVTGGLGCNDFTSRARFEGDVFTFYRPTLTTHRTCSDAVMRDEQTLLTSEKNPRSLPFSAETDSWGTDEDFEDPTARYGYGFKALDN
ncbi:META domain-containing protein [Streptomyces sp. NPDC020801]|uniref:META domain-containing protein n=1 Tax=unclassified Streptomyces TaxID=2593676 RepID=UPI0037AC80FC